MKAENLISQPFNRKNYVQTVLVLLGVAAFSAGTYVAWPALAHLGGKFI